MTALALVFGAAILLTWMLVQSYSGRRGSPARRRAHAAHGPGCSDTGWMFSGTDTSGCSPGDGGGGCGDGGGGGD